MKKLRYLSSNIAETLEQKMVFIGGARQVGKTTLSLQFLSPATVKNPAYLNWDRAPDKALILENKFSLDQPILIFDEIHKYKKWRNLVKGLYDKNKDEHKFIVTGSARLDYFRKGGDSLLGRYRYYRLHPFSVSEMSASANKTDLAQLLKFGGFPEPLFAGSDKNHRFWVKERLNRVVNEDLRDLENIKEISLVSLLAELLQTKVGSPLSLQSLQEDLQVSQPTIARWVQALCNMYYCYQIAPYGAPKIRAVKKLQKLYLWDWSEVQQEAFRFENLVASHLLKYCHYIEDTEGFNMELRYLRDTDLREIDFVVLKNKKPLFAVECKTGDRALSPHIKYFKERTDIPAFYQVHLNDKDYGHAKDGRVIPFIKFCKEMGMV
jgi:uncharacterized protein